MTAQHVAQSEPPSGAGSAKPGPTGRLPIDLTSRQITTMVLLAICWLALILLSTAIHLSKFSHHIVVFAHLMSLVAGFGAVLVIDVCAFSVLLGRSSAAFVARVAATVDPLLWLGVAGLGLSGLLMEPNLGDPLMWVKLFTALIAVLNGVAVRGVMATMAAIPEDMRITDLPRPLVNQALVMSLISQAAWWTTLVIGYFGEVSLR